LALLAFLSAIMPIRKRRELRSGLLVVCILDDRLHFGLGPGHRFGEREFQLPLALAFEHVQEAFRSRRVELLVLREPFDHWEEIVGQ
jgi:hypothetical protein